MLSRKRLWLVAAGLSALLSSSSAMAQEREMEPTPPPPPNRYLLGGGAALFLIPYGASVVVASETTRGSGQHLYVPVVGPFIAIGTRDCDREACAAKGLSAAMYVVDGVVQLAGAAMIGAAFFVPERVTTLHLGKTGKMTVVPSKVSADGYGVGAFGEF